MLHSNISRMNNLKIHRTQKKKERKKKLATLLVANQSNWNHASADCRWCLGLIQDKQNRSSIKLNPNDRWFLFFCYLNKYIPGGTGSALHTSAYQDSRSEVGLSNALDNKWYHFHNNIRFWPVNFCMFNIIEYKLIMITVRSRKVALS